MSGKYVTTQGAPIYSIDGDGNQIVSGYEPDVSVFTPTPGSYNNGVYTPLTMDGSYHQASNAAAAVARGKYDLWKETFFPKVNDLMNMTTYMNKDLVGQETASASGIANKAFDNVAAGQAQNVARFGMSQTAEQKAADASALSLGRTAATVDAENSTRLALKDRDRAIATGGIGTVA